MTVRSYVLLNLSPSVSPRDPRHEAIHWLSDAQLDRVRSLQQVAAQRRIGR